jgi:hypothetical protein
VKTSLATPFVCLFERGSPEEFKCGQGFVLVVFLEKLDGVRTRLVLAVVKI